MRTLHSEVSAARRDQADQLPSIAPMRSNREGGPVLAKEHGCPRPLRLGGRGFDRAIVGPDYAMPDRFLADIKPRSGKKAIHDPVIG
jgi:hypothetical protein